MTVTAVPAGSCLCSRDNDNRSSPLAVPSYVPAQINSPETSKKLFSQPSNSDQEGYLHVFPQWVPWLQALSFRFLPSSSVRRVYMASGWARHALEAQVAGLGLRLGQIWPRYVCMYACWYVCMHKPGACMPHDRDNKQIPINPEPLESRCWLDRDTKVQHFVWPFRGNGERRTIAANVARHLRARQLRCSPPPAPRCPEVKGSECLFHVRALAVLREA